MGVDADRLTDSLRRLAGENETGSGVHQALRRVTQACVDLFEVTGSGIMVADEQNVTSYVAASDGPGRLLEETESASGQGPCTVAFIENRLVATRDLPADDRWPDLAERLRGHGVRAVLGIPVRLGGVPVGTLDVYRDVPHDWDDSERRALLSYGEVVETALDAALRAHTAGELADQLQYALDHRVTIERAVGYLMARERVDAVTAFNQLRRVARSRRSKIGEIADLVLAGQELPAAAG